MKSLLKVPIYIWLPAPSPEPWFTVQHRTYRVCFDCGKEFNLPDAPIRMRSNAAPGGHSQTNSRHAPT